MTIHPTQTCFDDTTYFMAQLLVTDPEFDPGAYRIVHGICLLEDGTPYAHAWVEKDGTEAIGCGVIDGKRYYYGVDRRDYYRHFRPQELIRYTLDDVVTRETGGPWESHFQKHCRDNMKENK